MGDDLVALDKDCNSIIKRLVISRNSKATIIHQLKRFGIKKEYLFSDDIDTVLKSIVEEQRMRYPDS